MYIAYCIYDTLQPPPQCELPFSDDLFQVSGATSSRGYRSVVSGVVGAQSFAGARNSGEMIKNLIIQILEGVTMSQRNPDF